MAAKEEVVVAKITVNNVRARSSLEARIFTAATIQSVGARSAYVLPVATGSPFKNVISLVSNKEKIVPSSTEKLVAARPPVESVIIAAPPIKSVNSAVSNEAEINSAATENAIDPLASKKKRVIPAAAEKRVSAGSADKR